MKRTQWFHEVARDAYGLAPTGASRALHSGHINDSVVLETATGAVVFQILNTAVFAAPERVMHNALTCRDALRAANLPAPDYLTSVDGRSFVQADGQTVRAYAWIEGEATPPIRTPEDAQATARAFGRFVTAVADVELDEHLVGYHDFDRRLGDLDAAVTNDECGRLDRSSDTVGLVLAIADRLRLSTAYETWRNTPRRNVHNDAKGPNCVIGVDGQRTIIDLDTAMPGRLLSDVGELVRSSTRSIENASDDVLMAQVEAVNRGFLAGLGIELSDDERKSLLLAGPLLATENAVRFLTDHLQGDKYYGAEEPDQNLRRALEQIRLAERLVGAIEWATSSF